MKEVNNVIEEMRKEGFIDKAFKECGLDPSLHQVEADKVECTVNTK